MVVHVVLTNIPKASDLTFSSKPDAVIPWVIDATRTILEAASKHSTIRRVVLTSSSRACYTSTRASTRGVNIDESKDRLKMSVRNTVD